MDNEKIKKILEQQLVLLSEKSKNETDAGKLVQLTSAITKISGQLAFFY